MRRTAPSKSARVSVPNFDPPNTFRDLLIHDVESRRITGSIADVDAALRCDHEVAWMREEIAEIETVADYVVAAGADTGSRVSAALEQLRTHRSRSDHAPDVQAEYDHAGEVLSCALEAAIPAGGTLRDRVRSVLENRLHREVEIRGNFTVIGR
jgi:hypothetical protein